MSNYVVTGIAGFIGSKVTELLLSQGHQVTGIDNLSDAYDVRLKEWRLGQIQGQPNFHFHALDICDRAELRTAFGPGIDRVINLAARAGGRQSVENPWIYIDTNVTGTLNLLDLCQEFGIKKFVLSSTSSLYGDGNPVPFREDADTNAPLSPYAASKKAAEALCYTYHYLHGIDVTVLRYFTVYGPAGRPDMSMFRFVQWISEGKPVTVFGDGQQSRDFTYVEDIARGTVAALKLVGFEVINLGSDRPAILMDVIRMVEKQIGREAIIEYQARHAADVLATWADITKAKRMLGWQPQTSLTQGVENLVNWYYENQGWAREIETG